MAAVLDRMGKKIIAHPVDRNGWGRVCLAAPGPAVLSRGYGGPTRDSSGSQRMVTPCVRGRSSRFSQEESQHDQERQRRKRAQPSHTRP